MKEADGEDVGTHVGVPGAADDMQAAADGGPVAAVAAAAATEESQTTAQPFGSAAAARSPAESASNTNRGALTWSTGHTPEAAHHTLCDAACSFYSLPTNG